MSFFEQKAPFISSSPKVDHQFNRAPATSKESSTGGQAKIVGIYGLSGSGKTSLLNQLKKQLDHEHFLFFEGSEAIAALVPGGLQAFQSLDEQYKTHWRQLAVESIKEQCTSSGQTAIVTGHYMFWSDAEEEGHRVCTQADLAAYSHILYMDVSPEIIERRSRNDTKRKRPEASANHLLKWQQAEKAELSSLCRKHGILFMLLASELPLPKISALLQDFSVHNEEYNTSQAKNRLNEILAPYQGRLETVLVLDADKTLAAEDAGLLFWKMHAESLQDMTEEPLKPLFGGPLGYSYEAFRQAMLLYEQTVDDRQYEVLCQRVASTITMYPQLVSLLRLVAQQRHIGSVVVSCGLRRVWEIVLDRESLSGPVGLVAGGRITDGLVVTATVKATIVTHLQTFYHAYVWAFGDSPLDLEMLKAADRAVVVVGDELSRSKTMDTALLDAIERHGFHVCQALLPQNTTSRLEASKLPVVDLTGIEFISALLAHRNRHSGFLIYHATDTNAAKLLATPMRDAAIAGSALRKAHHNAGWYLACEYLTQILGIEECPIMHVLGHETTGSRLLHEQQTTIVALMRGGEPMASGVSDAFPLAMYVHANRPIDIKPHHLHGQKQIVLVDSVVNTGKTIMEFLHAIRNLNTDIPIVVVAGVVQSQCLASKSPAYQALTGCGHVSLVALRLSDTKFVGSGTTDTGNRLFNTTHLL